MAESQWDLGSLKQRARSAPTWTPATDRRPGEYDVIVVGGGHNGLVSAALFAQTGARVVVLEARERTGGCTDTSAPWPEHPDFKVSTYSYVSGLMPQALIRQLELDRHGLRTYPLGPYFQAFPDGRALTLYEDPKKSHASLAQFSTADADAFGRFEAWLGGIAEVLWPMWLSVPPRLGSLSPDDLRGYLKLAWQARGLGVRGVADLTRLFTMSVAEILDEWFESDPIKGLLANTATIGAWAGPRARGTAYILFHLSMGDPGDGHVGGWGFVRGGMGGLAAVCRRAAEAHGVEVRTEARVAKILSDERRVTGVALAEGDELHAPLVVSTLHPKTTFLELVARDQLPTGFVDDIERFKTRGGAVKINLAISELPDFTAAPSPEGRLAGAAPHRQHGAGAVGRLRAGRVRRCGVGPGRAAAHRRRHHPLRPGRLADARGHALPLDLLAVGATHLGRQAAPRRPREVRRPRDRRLHRTGPQPPRLDHRPPDHRAPRHEARARPRRRQRLRRRAVGRPALPHASGTRLLRLSHADRRPLQRLGRRPRRRRRERHPRLAGVPARDEGSEEAMTRDDIDRLLRDHGVALWGVAANDPPMTLAPTCRARSRSPCVTIRP